MIPQSTKLDKLISLGVPIANAAMYTVITSVFFCYFLFDSGF